MGKMRYYGLDKGLVDLVLEQKFFDPYDDRFQCMPAYGTFYEKEGKIFFKMETFSETETIDLPTNFNPKRVDLNKMNDQDCCQIRMVHCLNKKTKQKCYELIIVHGDTEEEAREEVRKLAIQRMVKELNLTSKKALQRLINEVMGEIA